MRLAIVCSHPIQYYSPLFRALAEQIDLHVFFAHRPSASQQGVGFDAAFAWDVDLTAGFPHSFLSNIAKTPSVERFGDFLLESLRARIRRKAQAGVPHLERWTAALARLENSFSRSNGLHLEPRQTILTSAREIANAKRHGVL